MTRTPPARGFLARFFHDLRVGASRGGVMSLIGRVARARTSPLFARVRLLVIEQDTGAIADVRTPEGVRIAPLEGTAEEDAALDRLLTSGIRRHFARRLAAGRECLVAWRGDRAIGYTWMSRTVDPAVESLPLALPDDAAYLWDLFVVRDERGSGVGSALTRARLGWARDAGFARGWRAISPRNRPSVRTAEKTGAVRILGEIVVERILGSRRFREVRAAGRPLLRE
jgi:GNAT superfamily N-acetyltransferase